MSQISINGISYSGDNVTIKNNKVYIDGKEATEESKIINIQINGDVNKLEVDTCNSMTVTGNTGSVKTVSGDIEISGNVTGTVSSVSGDVSAYSIGGSVLTVSGDIKTLN